MLKIINLWESVACLIQLVYRVLRHQLHILAHILPPISAFDRATLNLERHFLAFYKDLSSQNFGSSLLVGDDDLAALLRSLELVLNTLGGLNPIRIELITR